MNFRKGQGREDPEINLIAFIDVLLVILIFLMVSTSYSKFTALQITLPTADAEKAMGRPFEINVGVDAQGRYSINNNRVAVQNPEGLAAELTAAAAASGKANPDPVVIIAADATTTHQTVINVLEAARIAGYSKVTFAAQTSGKK
ncbi:ExbD/TolR family protein [Herminiimonas arsenitoxidans]|uniref:ExbD/TolR family protein n=1 Tax=Herminiimonas arsenitoxidans TaxID=1809410 RepID=UPI000970A02E|nr:biopolymer transporter ExbD [Herminiimonas arsenitoxidans]